MYLILVVLLMLIYIKSKSSIEPFSERIINLRKYMMSEGYTAFYTFHGSYHEPSLQDMKKIATRIMDENVPKVIPYEGDTLYEISTKEMITPQKDQNIYFAVKPNYVVDVIQVSFKGDDVSKFTIMKGSKPYVDSLYEDNGLVTFGFSSKYRESNRN